MIISELLLLTPHGLLTGYILSKQVKCEIVTLVELLQQSLFVDLDSKQIKEINQMPRSLPKYIF
jgi:hypothetical protein